MASSRIRSILGPSLGACVTGFFWFHHRTPFHLALFFVAAVLLVLAVFFPRMFAPLDRAVQRVVAAVLQIFTYALLLTLFVAIFVPTRIFLLATGRDPLRRKLEPTAASYWSEVSTVRPQFDRLY